MVSCCKGNRDRYVDRNESINGRRHVYGLNSYRKHIIGSARILCSRYPREYNVDTLVIQGDQTFWYTRILYFNTHGEQSLRKYVLTPITSPLKIQFLSSLDQIYCKPRHMKSTNKIKILLDSRKSIFPFGFPTFKFIKF